MRKKRQYERFTIEFGSILYQSLNDFPVTDMNAVKSTKRDHGSFWGIKIGNGME